MSDDGAVFEHGRSDYLASAIKSLVGAVPFAGSLLSEIVGTVIPNQRIDRIAKFTYALQRELERLDEEVVRAKLADENFTELVEEGLRQAVRSTTEDRRTYIASILGASLTADHISFVESKYLLRLLGEINDIEILRLGSYLYSTGQDGRNQYLRQHALVLDAVDAGNGDPTEHRVKAALQKSYDNHLEQLGLIKAAYSIDSQTGLPRLDHAGRPQVQYYEITSIGELLLRSAGFPFPYVREG